jgi:hypothetical protein
LAYRGLVRTLGSSLKAMPASSFRVRGGNRRFRNPTILTMACCILVAPP